MSKNGELPEVDPSWKDRGSLGGQFNYEQRSEAFLIRERLFEEVEQRVGKSQMFLDQIVRAIKEGVGEEYTLALKAMTGIQKGKERLRSIVPAQIYMAIISYEKV